MPIYPTHAHQFSPIDENGEECRSCGYTRWRGVVGSEYVPEPNSAQTYR